jgi:tRNA uridine 5-carbamoylmethylation protein Kti12
MRELILITGLKGSGKTYLGRIIAKEKNAKEVQTLKEIDDSSDIFFIDGTTVEDFIKINESEFLSTKSLILTCQNSYETRAIIKRNFNVVRKIKMQLQNNLKS